MESYEIWQSAGGWNWRVTEESGEVHQGTEETEEAAKEEVARIRTDILVGALCAQCEDFGLNIVEKMVDRNYDEFWSQARNLVDEGK